MNRSSVLAPPAVAATGFGAAGGRSAATLSASRPAPRKTTSAAPRRERVLPDIVVGLPGGVVAVAAPCATTATTWDVPYAAGAGTACPALPRDWRRKSTTPEPI